jgi:hypothetical protein
VLKVDGQVVDTQKMERTIPFILAWDESLEVGSDTGTWPERVGRRSYFAGEPPAAGGGFRKA